MTPIILCCGEHGRAVVYGRVESPPEPGQPVTLHGARMVLYWSERCGGLFGLASKGPAEGTRITVAVESTVATKWTEVVSVTKVAAKAFDAWEGE